MKRVFLVFFTLLLLQKFFVTVWAQEISHEHNIHYAFVENKGQWDPDVLFQAKIQGGNLWIQQQKFVFHLQDFSNLHAIHDGKAKNKQIEPVVPQTVVHLEFVGSQKVSTIEKKAKTPEYYNYFIGNDKQKWASDVHGYGEAVMREFYPGIDLQLIEQQQQLKYEFHVKPYADPSLVLLKYTGQKQLQLAKNGDLLVKTNLGNIIEKKPYAYQIINGRIRDINCEFIVSNNQVYFKFGNYDRDVELVIDPTLIFATYSGSVTDNFGMTATYGHDGTAFSGGMIFGNAYPTPDNAAYDVNSTFTVANNASYGITDAFISHYSANGTTMIWTTFLGGGSPTQGTETAQSMICDANNNLYVYGSTSSTDFPIVNGYQATHAGGTSGANFYYNGVYFTSQGTDIYIAKISANGHNLLASTYFGGSANDGINTKVTSGTYNNFGAYDSLTINYGDQFRGEIMLDPAGNCLVASCTKSANFPVLNAFQSTLGGMQDGVIFSLTPDLSTLNWSSYYGGTNNDACYSLKVDNSLNIVFTGGTCSPDLSFTSGGWQPTYNGGKADGFVVKLAPTGTSVVQASYVGTANLDQSVFVDIDHNNNVYLLGVSAGGAFPVNNAGFVNVNSNQFILKLDPNLTTNLNSTTFGNGSSALMLSPAAFMVDVCGNIYVSVWGANIIQSTPLSGMPVTANAFQSSPPNGFDFFLLVLEHGFNNLLYGTYIGGNQADEHVDGGTSRFDNNGVVYQSVCGGCGGHSDFPTTPGAWSNYNLSNNCNNIIFKFEFDYMPKADFTASDTSGCAPLTVTLTNSSATSDSYLWDFGNGDTSSVILNPVLTFDTAGVYQVYLYVTDSVCLLTDSAEMTISVVNAVQLSVSSDTIMCTASPITLTADTDGSATYFVWSSNAGFTDTLNTSLADSVITFIPLESGTYYVKAGSGACYKTDSVVVSLLSAAIFIEGQTGLCKGDSTVLTAVNSASGQTFSYLWSPDSLISGSITASTVVVSPSVSQYVYLLVTSSSGCQYTDSIQVLVSSIGNDVSAEVSDPIVATGATVTLSGSPSGFNYTWSPSEGVANVHAQNTTALITETTTFTLTVTDGICTKSDTVTVKVFQFVCGDPYIYIPNAFSPNGDGENDMLYVRGDMINDMLFRVFDRWGELVFESTDRLIGWDGIYKGRQLDPDVYDYYLKVTCLDGNETIIKGNVTLMR